MDIENKINEKVQNVPLINYRKCSGCNKCIDVCKQNVLALKDINQDTNKSRFFRRRKLKAVVQHGMNCTSCGLCSSVCRHKAILIT